MPKRKSKKKQGRKRAQSVVVSRLPKRSEEARDRSMHAIAFKRRNPKKTMTSVAQLHGVKPATIEKYFPSALRKVKGKLEVTGTDRYSATLYVPDADGSAVPVHTRSSKDRKELSRYLRDLGRYLGGKRNALTPWRGKIIAGVELVTSGDVIVSIEPALSEFSLYRSTNSGA